MILKYTEIEQAFRDVPSVSRVEFVKDEIWVVLPVDKFDDAPVNHLRTIEGNLRATDPDLPRVFYLSRKGNAGQLLTL